MSAGSNLEALAVTYGSLTDPRRRGFEPQVRSE